MKRESKQVSAGDSGIMRAFSHPQFVSSFRRGRISDKEILYGQKLYIICISIVGGYALHIKNTCCFHFVSIFSVQATPFERIVDYGCLCTIKY